MRVTIDSMESESHRRQVAREAKAIVALAFRNGPIENIHAGRPCPTCSDQAGYSRITDAEMKAIMVPSGDHAGKPFPTNPVEVVNGKASDPSAFITQILPEVGVSFWLPSTGRMDV